MFASWPLGPGSQWLEYVYQVETEAELEALRRSTQRGTPFRESWADPATPRFTSQARPVRP